MSGDPTREQLVAIVRQRVEDLTARCARLQVERDHAVAAVEAREERLQQTSVELAGWQAKLVELEGGA